MKRVPQMRNCVSTICTNCRVFPTEGMGGDSTTSQKFAQFPQPKKSPQQTPSPKFPILSLLGEGEFLSTPYLRLKKSPAFEPVTEDFNLKWDQVLYDAERSLVKLILHESQEVIAKIELDITTELGNLNIDDTVQK